MDIFYSINAHLPVSIFSLTITDTPIHLVLISYDQLNIVLMSSETFLVVQKMSFAKCMRPQK